MDMLLFIPLMIAVIYFLMIRPEQRRKRQAAELRESLQIGDQITTIGGIVGKVVQVQEDFVTFETSEDRVRIKVVKGAIANKGRGGEESQQDQIRPS